MKTTWQEISRRKKAEQISRIPKDWILTPIPEPKENGFLDVPRTSGILTEKELDITENYDATALSKEIATRRLRSIDVVRAFCKRAAIAHQVTNCLTEIFFDEALANATKLDEYLDSGKPPLSPLHGLPISLKDSFRVPGYDASIGIAALCFHPCQQQSTLVDVLRAGGAVLYCKTNMPQTGMAMDTHNFVFGRTLNPRNPELTVGGSSGGEGCLVGMRGSILGVGTDIGGSIRVPAMCNGIYGIKPSCQRIPYSGQESGTDPATAKLGVAASAGPITTSLRDCELFFRSIACLRPWELDHDTIPGLWESQRRCNSKSLVVGLVSTDGVTMPLPPILKVLEEAAQTLRKHGIEVLNLEITRAFSKCQSLTDKMFTVCGNERTMDLISETGEPFSPSLGQRTKKALPKSSQDIRALQARREEIQNEFLKIWKDDQGKDIDVIMCPVAPHPVPPADRWNAVGYTSSFVLLDYPAGVLPVRKFRKDDVHGEPGHNPPLSSWDSYNRELWTKVDRSIYVGSPLGIQVVAPRLQERRLYEAMQIIDHALSKDSNSLKVRGQSKM